MKRRMRRLVSVSVDCLIHLIPNVVSWLIKRF